MSPSPLYPPACTIAPAFTTACGLPIPSIGPASGLAIQPSCGLSGSSGPSTLWITDGTQIEGVNTLTGLTVTGAVAVTGLPPLTFLTGLEFDWAAGDLIACAADGWSYHVAVPTGVVTGSIAPSAAYLSAGSPPITCNVLDRGAGATGSYYVGDGPFVYPTAGTYASWLPFFSGVGSAPGASFSAEPVLLSAGCTCGSNPATIYTTKPPVCSLPPTIDLGIQTGPFVPAWLLLDFACCPVQVIPIPFNCTIWPCLPTALVLGPFTTFGNGSAIGLSVGTLPCSAVGLTVYAQWAYFCPSEPLGFSMTDAMHIRVSLP